MVDCMGLNTTSRMSQIDWDILSLWAPWCFVTLLLGNPATVTLLTHFRKANLAKHDFPITVIHLPFPLLEHFLICWTTVARSLSSWSYMMHVRESPHTHVNYLTISPGRMEPSNSFFYLQELWYVSTYKCSYVCSGAVFIIQDSADHRK